MVSMEGVAAIFVFLVCLLLGQAMGNVYFSKLPRTLNVTASPSPGQVLRAGEDTITVTWSLMNQRTPSGSDVSYRNVKVKLCYAPDSQKDRSWRKTLDDLKKDKTCQFNVAVKPYSPSNNTVTYTVKRDVPSATYFIRAYAVDSSDTQVAYGQTTNAQKTTNLFRIESISGRHASLDIAAACFSAFSVLSLAFFFVSEKRKAKK